MGRKLYVGNLGYGVTDSDLLKMFEAYGTVESAQVVMDRDTGRSKGFGFVEMKTDQEAQAAIAALNGQDAGGRALTVNEAKPRTEGGRGGSGGRGGYGRGGRGGGGGGAGAPEGETAPPRTRGGGVEGDTALAEDVGGAGEGGRQPLEAPPPPGGGPPPLARIATGQGAARAACPSRRT